MCALFFPNMVPSRKRFSRKYRTKEIYDKGQWQVARLLVVRVIEVASVVNFSEESGRVAAGLFVNQTWRISSVLPCP